MHDRPITLPLLAVLILLAIAVSGCGYSVQWYKEQPQGFSEAGVEVAALLWWASGPDSTCRGITPWQLHDKPRDSFLTVGVVLSPDTLPLATEALSESYAVDSVRIFVRSDTLHLPLCRDTSVFYPPRQYAASGPYRNLDFGPAYVGWPPPDSVVIRFDFLYRNPQQPARWVREPKVVVAKRESKSKLEDFLDGR